MRGSIKSKGAAKAKGAVRGGSRKPKNSNPRGFQSKKG